MFTEANTSTAAAPRNAITGYERMLKGEITTIPAERARALLQIVGDLTFMYIKHPKPSN